MCGCKILLVDIDPQSNATSGLGLKNTSMENSVYELLIGPKNPKECISETEIQNLSIIKSNINLVGVEIEIVGMDNREFLLKRKLVRVPAWHQPLFATGSFVFFFSREEPRIHVHVAHPDGEAKFWLTPQVVLANHTGLSAT